MKFLISFLLCIASLINMRAQITYEHTYLGPNSASEVRPQLINMGDNYYKYVEVDYASNQIKLYNLNHSSYATINVPIALSNSGEYTIGYVTKSLFDCDTTMFEYAIMPSSNWHNSFYIYRQDGTQLFKRDSTLGPYCFGCFTGSYDVRPVVNSPVGAKLFLMKADVIGYFQTTDVYSLCGTLPESLDDLNTASAQFVRLFPNPNSGLAEFVFDLPGNSKNYELTIFDSSSRIIESIRISGTTKKHRFENSSLSAGLYFFSFKDEKKILQTGKFITQ